MIPLWIVPEQYRELNPPAEVRVLATVRSAANLLAASRSLFVTSAPRYAPLPDGRTWCNVFASDLAAILQAPLPHRFDLGDGQGTRELRANDMADGLRRNVFPGWSRVLVGDAANRAALGLPTVAIWRNPRPAGAGHVVFVVPTPPGRTGIYVTGAGRACVDQCPIAQAFGGLVPQVEVYGHD
jgi:hypothetical protein